ncbi:rho guanine nucleotide exchange factor 11-like [Paramacrobiotus metropolitanus]|uniref:rho guanine nucleotide exchange factor 11-like n=1 Tax=Paramacrobiotus metropolitanus TaxID=2943436 RepID=UPI002445B696|nr:rho guanine nucleotide exchange factor 11-like [Paramacrobiotus metropolitanus]
MDAVTRRLASKKDHKNSKSDDHGEAKADQISVVFQRDERGYGLTVAGDNPVFVQVVTENGPAGSAGLQPGDRIIKVNNELVTRSNHTEVVRLIKSQHFVAMTVVRTPPNKEQHVNGDTGNSTTDSPQSKEGSVRSAARIQHLMRKLAEEKNVLLNLQEELASSPSEQVQMRIERVSKNIKDFQNMLNAAEHGRRGKGRGEIGAPRRSDDALRPLEQPPTPPPIERIPTRPVEDGGSPRSSSASNLNRRRSNPEAMHVGVARMALTASLPDQTVLGRSSSAVHVDVDSSGAGEEQPPALPVKRSKRPHPMDSVDLGTPAGSPPPPYPEVVKTSNGKVPKSGSFSGVSVGGAGRFQPARQLDIVTMEDPNFASLNLPQEPFSNYATVHKSLANLSAFLHYLIAIDQAPPLLFHLTTDLYPKGSQKELQRWAYEIHSTFIVPQAPLDFLSLPGGDPSHSQIVTAIDEVLSRPDKEDALRDVFASARSIALTMIQERLNQFQQVRMRGLSGMYNIDEVALVDTDKSSERARELVDSLLGRDLDRITFDSADEPENRSDRQAAIGCALATFLKANGVKAMGRDGAYLVDKWPLFLQKDKSKFKLKDKSKKSVPSHGHQFAPVSFSTTLYYCVVCNNCMWGVAPQGYQCTICDFIVHRNCMKCIEESCVGEKKDVRRSLISLSGVDSFFGRRRSNNSPTSLNNSAKKSQEDKEDIDATAGDASIEAPQLEPKSYVSQVVNRFESGKMDIPTIPSPTDPTADKSQKSQNLSVVGRSESLKTQKKQPAKPGVRKKSDPAHFYRDEGEDSASTSGVGSLGTSGISSVSSQSLPSNGSSNISTEGISAFDEDGSDFEADPDQIPNWQVNVDQTILDQMDNRARKRQDVIAELFHTEQTHVRNLKVLGKFFYQPLLRAQLLSADLITQVFANLEEMVQLHGELNRHMRIAKKVSPIVEKVGDILLSRFDGENGAAFKRAAAAFCREQAAGLEALKHSQKKDPKLAQFLQECAGNPLCRRLQLKDIIPTGMQRLTKYPLLLEQILKYSNNSTEEEKVEHEKVTRALGECKEILDFVNQAVKESNNRNRLKELQEKIDMTSFHKAQNKLAQEHKNLDLSRYRMLMDGDLTWKLSKKPVDLHVILLDRMLLLVTKQDDKLILKFHSPLLNVTDKKTGESFSGKYWAPVLSLEGLFVKDNATNPLSFYLISNTTDGAQMYEMIANTANEQKQWIKHINDAVARMSKVYETIPDDFPVTATPSVTAAPVGDVDVPDHVREEESEGELATEGLFQTEELPRATLLTSPSELVVTMARVEAAERILTPMEELKRHDEQLEESLSEKQRLVSQILGIEEKTEKVEEKVDSGQADAKTLLHRVLKHTESLTRLLKDSLKIVHEEGAAGAVECPGEMLDSPTVDCGIQTISTIPVVTTESLEPIQTGLNRNLTALLDVICQKEEETHRLRQDLQAALEEVQNLRLRVRSPSVSRAGSSVSARSEEDLQRLTAEDSSSLENVEDAHDVSSIPVVVQEGTERQPSPLPPVPPPEGGEGVQPI